MAHRHDGVGHGEGVGVAQVDLVLARRVFVLGVLDADAHLFEREDAAPPQLTADVVGQQVEVATLVQRHRGRGGLRSLK